MDTSEIQVWLSAGRFICRTHRRKPLSEKCKDSDVIDKESIRGIVKILNRENILGPTGKHWSRSTVSRILRYEGYTGRSIYNRTISKQGLQGRMTEERDSEEWVEFTMPAIISNYIFQMAQERLNSNRKHARRKPKKGRFYLLRGMVFCNHCKKTYVCQAIKPGKNRRLRPSLIYRHRLSEGHCMNCQVNANAIEAQVWEKMVGLINDPEKLLVGFRRSREQSLAKIHEKQEHLKTLHEAAEKIKQKRTQLTMVYSDLEVGMTKEEYLESRLALNEEMESVNQQIEELENEIASLPTPADIETFTTFTAEIRGIRMVI